MNSTILQNPYRTPIHDKISYSQLGANKPGCLVNHNKTKRDITYEYITNGESADSSSGLLHPNCSRGGVV